MSNDHGWDSIWIGDLDGYISIDAIVESNRREAEEESLLREFEEIGDIPLLSGKVIAAHNLRHKTRGLSEWRWAVHHAETKLGVATSGYVLEQAFARSLIDLGRAYAIRRYAKWEKIPHSSARTASLPFGINALLLQYLNGQGLLTTLNCRKRIATVMKAASKLGYDVAYQRAGAVQTLIHSLAYEAFGPDGPASLHRDATRTMLSLARLHHSVNELRVQSFADIAKLHAVYGRVRKAAETDNGYHITGQNIAKWRLRHLRPLTDLFPLSIRRALERGISHATAGQAFERATAVNELAVAHSSLLMTRRREKAF